MTGTIHQLVQQAKHDEMLEQAANARTARMTAKPKGSRSRSVRVLIATLLVKDVAGNASRPEAVSFKVVR